MNTPSPDHRGEDLPTRAMRALTEAAELHERPGQALQSAMSKAAHVVMALARDGGDGLHELYILVAHPDGDLEFTLPYEKSGRVFVFPEDGAEQLVVVLLSIADLAGSSGTMTLRSRQHAAGPDSYTSTLRGWRLQDRSVQPMTEAELFALASNRGGEPTAPAPETRFRTAFNIDSSTCPTCP